MIKINVEDKIHSILTAHPYLKDFFVNNGFNRLVVNGKVSPMAKIMKLSSALKGLSIDQESFMKKLNDYLQSLNIEDDSDNYDINFVGLLPCPIQTAIVDSLDEFIEENKSNFTVRTSLQSASMGIDFVKSQIPEDIEKCPDILMSAGYEMYFGNSVIGKKIKDNKYMAFDKKLHSLFDNENLSLKDPLGHFNVIGVVPCVILVDKVALGDRPIPKSWSDLLDSKYEGCITIPLNDLDMFNAVVLNIYNKYGETALKKLAKNVGASLHPSQMANARTQRGAGAISVIPYFFANMSMQRDDIEVIWPEDGAIISPIFLTFKTTSEKKIEKIANFLLGKNFGSLFSKGGNFPSTNYEVDNTLVVGKKFMWTDWEFLNNTDIEKLLEKIEKEFKDAMII